MFFLAVNLIWIITCNAMQGKRASSGATNLYRNIVAHPMPPIWEDEEFTEEDDIFGFTPESSVGAIHDANIYVKELVAHMADGVGKDHIMHLLFQTALTMPTPFTKKDLLSVALCDGPLGKSSYAPAMGDRFHSLFLGKNIIDTCNNLHRIKPLSYVNVKDQPSVIAHENDDSVLADFDFYNYQTVQTDKAGGPLGAPDLGLFRGEYPQLGSKNHILYIRIALY
jgi:hypothetical protein